MRFMKIYLSQCISLNTFNKGNFRIKKEFESNIIPHAGDKIGDSVWKEPYEYEVVETIINYSEDECYVELAMMKFDNVGIFYFINYFKLGIEKTGKKLYYLIKIYIEYIKENLCI